VVPPDLDRGGTHGFVARRRDLVDRPVTRIFGETRGAELTRARVCEQSRDLVDRPARGQGLGGGAHGFVVRRRDLVHRPGLRFGVQATSRPISVQNNNAWGDAGTQTGSSRGVVISYTGLRLGCRV
jgi:hypothetical protein